MKNIKLLLICFLLPVSSYGQTFPQIGSDIGGEAPNDYSGWSVSLSSDGTIVAIGALYNDANGSQSGHVRLYNYSDGSWIQLGSDIDGEAAGDISGYPVSLSDDGATVAIGAIYNDGNGTDAGHVRVYNYSNSNWTQIGSDIDGEAAGDYSGIAVSLSSDGTTLAIGAELNVGNGDTDAGHVRVYNYSNGNWTQIGSDIDGEAAYDYSGRSVSLSSDGTIVAIGALGNDGNGTDAGHVRVYNYSNSNWTQIGSDIDGEAAGDNSGMSVSLSSDGTVLAIGAQNNDGNGVDAGHARVYNYSNGNWTQIASDIDGEAASDNSGMSVSLSSDGTVLAIGAQNNDGNGVDAGHARVYNYSNGNWTQIASDIDGEAASDNSGMSVSLSSDGTIVAIGAQNNDGNGTDAGHVRVYNYFNFNWTQIASDIDGEAASDYSGMSVSLSSDGTNLAIGAKGNDGNGLDAGHVRVYQISSGVFIEDNLLNSIILNPNPSKGLFSIELDQENIGSTYKILDSLGRLIDKGIIREVSQNFDLSDKPKGVYRIQVSNDKSMKTLNVVIQ